MPNDIYGIFYSYYCSNCYHDADYRRGCGNGCVILEKSILNNLGDPDFPKELTLKNGTLVCDAYQHEVGGYLKLIK